MKHSVKVMSFVMALSGTTAMVPQASAQTQPAKPSNRRKLSNTRTPTVGPRVRQPEPLSEPSRETLARERRRNGSWPYGPLLAAQGGKNAKKRAEVAVVRKLAVLLYKLWVSRETYEPLRIAGRESRLSTSYSCILLSGDAGW